MRDNRALALASRRQRAAEPFVTTLPPPVGGWNARDAWSDMDPTDAVVLDNWYPGLGKVTVRGGSALWSQTGTSEPIETLAVLDAVGGEKLIAAGGGGLWDVTDGNVLMPIGGSQPFTSDRWQVANMNGQLALANGTNTPQRFDGTTKFAMTISGAGLNVPNLVGINVFKSRSYFWEEGSADFWVSEVNALGGALTIFPLADVSPDGGHLLGMFNWTRDGGAGPDDAAVFLMSNGAVAIYEGSNPNEIDDWFLVGVYKIGAPVGRRAWLKVGGDVLILTADGYVSLVTAIRSARGGRDVALNDKIVKAAAEQTKASRGLFGWQPVHYPRGNRLLVNYPTGGRYEQHVLNLATGAWCRFRGMDALCWAVFQDRLFFGGADGKVWEADVGTTDGNAKIVADARQAFSYLGARSHNKQVTMVGPLFEAIGEVNARIGLASDFNPNPQAQVDAQLGEPASLGSAWDTALWDTVPWATRASVVQGWIAHSALGYAISPSVRVEQNVSRVSWNGTRLAYVRAGVI